MNALGFANPLGAATLAAVVALVALHLWDRRRRVIPVSTLLIWRQLPPAPLERRRRLRPDALFFLQLALLLALILGYLRPWVSTAGTAAGAPSLLIVIDVSASMQAREVEGTRFALARERAAALVRDDTETMLVAAAERPRVLVRWTRDAPLVRRRLETLEPLDVAGDLAPALALAVGEARARPGTRVAVFTDLPPQAIGLPPDDLATVDYVQLGRTDDNVAVARLTIEAPPFHAATDATATVVVRNHGHTARHVALEARVGADLWARRTVDLDDHGTATVRLDRPPGDGIVTITLDADDALAADDVALAWLPRGAPLDLLVVSEAPSAFGALARTMTNGRAEEVSLARWTADPAMAGTRVVVFDRIAPPGPPPAHALYVAPPAGSDACPVDETADDAAVIDWDADHPIVAGLGGLEALVVPHASVLAATNGTVVTLAVSRRRTFPFLVAGERDGHRVACLAAGITTPLASSDQLPLLLLTLGTLAWLAPDGDATPLIVRTGVATRDGDVPVLADHVGAQHAGTRLVLASLLDDHESDIGRDGGGTWPATAGIETMGLGGTHEIGWWCYLAGALLLAGEWAVWLGRRGGSRAGRPSEDGRGAPVRTGASGGFPPRNPLPTRHV
jgi:Ca-activated chloride channel family protein